MTPWMTPWNLYVTLLYRICCLHFTSNIFCIFQFSVSWLSSEAMKASSNRWRTALVHTWTPSIGQPSTKKWLNTTFQLIVTFSVDLFLASSPSCFKAVYTEVVFDRAAELSGRSNQIWRQKCHFLSSYSSHPCHTEFTSLIWSRSCMLWNYKGKWP